MVEGKLAAVIPLRKPADRAKTLSERVVPGRLSELSGLGSSGRTTAAVSLVIQAQAMDEPVAWLEPDDGALYPPDLADAGIDLDALVVVRVPAKARGRGLCRAAELLLRSGAFGLLIVDLSVGRPRGDAWQGRLSALAREHEARVVLLSDQQEEAPSLGTMVGLRVAPRRERRSPGHFVVTHAVLKDKTGGGAAVAVAPCTAPPGLS